MIKYFKDNANRLHAIDKGFEYLLPDGLTEISEQEYLEFSNPPPDLNQIIDQFESGVQSHLDTKAQEAGYDNILTACSYAGAPNPFEAESKTFVTWRGNVWAYCYSELQKVIAGTRPMPTLEDIISELPVRALP